MIYLKYMTEEDLKWLKLWKLFKTFETLYWGKVQLAHGFLMAITSFDEDQHTVYYVDN